MRQVAISVIIPIYKADQYLRTCLDSVLAQTFTDFEVLLIDDASPDSSASICDAYAAKDKRIRVFHEKVNGGESVARNIGLDNAMGRYIVFVDADDRVLPDYIASLYYCDNIPSGTLVHAPVLREIYGVLDQMAPEKQAYSIDHLVGEETQTDFLFAGPTWSKLFETALIRKNNIHFKADIKMNVDHTFHLEYLLHIHAYRNVGKRTYIYIIRAAESLSTRTFPFEELCRRLDYLVPLTWQVMTRFEIKNKQLQKDIFSTPANVVISSVFSLYRQPFRKSRKERIKGLKKVLGSFRFLVTDYYTASTAVEKCIRSVLLLKSYFLMDVLLSTVVWARYSLGNKSVINK